MPDSGVLDWQRSPDGHITITVSRSTSSLPLEALRREQVGWLNPWACDGEVAFILQIQYTLTLETMFRLIRRQRKDTLSH